MEIIAKIAAIVVSFQIVVETILYIRDPQIDFDDSRVICRFYAVWLTVRLGMVLFLTAYLLLWG